MQAALNQHQDDYQHTADRHGNQLPFVLPQGRQLVQIREISVQSLLVTFQNLPVTLNVTDPTPKIARVYRGVTLVTLKSPKGGCPPFLILLVLVLVLESDSWLRLLPEAPRPPFNPNPNLTPTLHR
jgi:hypothetical protein